MNYETNTTTIEKEIITGEDAGNEPVELPDENLEEVADEDEEEEDTEGTPAE